MDYFDIMINWKDICEISQKLRGDLGYLPKKEWITAGIKAWSFSKRPTIWESKNMH